MNVIKTSGKYQLLHERLQNMYLVTDGDNHSFWFNSHTKDELIEMSDTDFEQECEKLIESSNT